MCSGLPKSNKRGDIQKDIVNKQKAKAEIAEIQGRLDYWSSVLASMNLGKGGATRQLTEENFADRSELYLPENPESLPDLVPTQAKVVKIIQMKIKN